VLLGKGLGKGADGRYVSGSVASRMAQAFHGEHKTDAKDAVIIAQTLRVRSDLPRITMTDAVQMELKLLTARRIALVDERERIWAANLAAPAKPAQLVGASVGTSRWSGYRATAGPVPMA
jgi:hypothetical protein